ncbi:MAG: winged helix-turn-helix domain-containing protein [Tahibacter sp.]
MRILRPQDQTRYARLGDWLIDLASNRLLRAEREIRPTPKAMAVLRQLMLAGGNPLTRAELLDSVWRDAFPTDDVLTHAITELRRAMEVDPKVPRLIETIPKVGYRLLQPVEWLESLPGAAGSEPSVDNAEEGTKNYVEKTPQRPVLLWVVLAALGAIALLIPLLGPQPPPSRVTLRPPDQVYTSLQARPVTAESDSETFPSIAPDGSSVAYSARYPGDEGMRIYLRGLSGSPPIRLTRATNGEETYPVWSPDGTQIAFVRLSSEECRIVVVAALGGHEREVTSCAPHLIDYIDWSSDGRALLVSRYRSVVDKDGNSASEGPSIIQTLHLDDGKLAPLDYDFSTNQPDIQPRVSPDGKRIAFRRGAVPYSDIFVVPSTGGKARQLTRLRSRIRGYDWLPDGRHLLFSSDHNGTQGLYLLDSDNGEIASLGFAGGSFPAVSRGRPVAVFQQDNADVNLQSFRFDAAYDAAGEGIASSTRAEAWPAFAPNDDRLVFASNRGGDSQLWLYEPGARTSYQLTHHKNVEVANPNWSPDGRRVLYVVRGAGHSRLYSIDVDSGQTRVQTDENENVSFGTYSYDGRSIFFVSDRKGPWQLWQRSIDHPEAKLLTSNSAFNLSDNVGDGLIYYTRMNENGLYSLDPASGEEHNVTSAINYWNKNAWRADRTGLYYLYGTDDLKPTLYQQPWSGGPPKALRQIEWAAPDTNFALDREATRVVVPVVARDDTDVMLLDMAPLERQ